MITGKNKSKILTKDISCKCKCEFYGRTCNSNQYWNNDKCRCECKKCHIWEKDYIWNPATFSCENRQYLASIIDNSVSTWDEIIEETRKVPKSLNKIRIPAKNKISIFYLHF